MKRFTHCLVVLAFLFTIFIPVRSVEAAVTKLTTYQTSASVYLRTSPSYKGKQTVLIPKQKTVTYVSKSGSWLKVSYAKKVGYVHTKSIVRTVTSSKKIKDTPYVTVQKSPMYNGVGSNKRVVHTLKKGTNIIATEQLGKYVKVRYGKKTGWMRQTDLKKKVMKQPTKTSFLLKKQAIDYLRNYVSPTQYRPLFKVERSAGIDFANAHLFSTSRPIDDYLFAIVESGERSIVSLTLIEFRYNRYPSGQLAGDEIAHVALASFFGEETKETEQLRKLYATYKRATKNEVVPITVGGHKGLLVVWYGRVQYVFDYNDELPTIRL